MKKLYSLLFITISSLGSLLAQPTLTVANFTQTIGDSQLFYDADSNAVINTTTGENVIFDYSNLLGSGGIRTQYILDPTSTTFGSEYPNATLSDSTQGSPVNKNYSKLNSTDSLTKEGTVASVPTYGTIVGKYDMNPEISMKFPFNYGDNYVDDYAGNFTVDAAIPVTTAGNGNAIVNADGWGTLLLPMGVSIDSVLRVKTTEFLVTDTIILGFPINLTILPITISGETINYYKPSLSNFPLLAIIRGSYRQEDNVLDSTQYILSQYQLAPLNTEELVNEELKSSLFPNPTTSNVTTLTLDLKENNTVSVSIFNTIGQNVNTIFNGALTKGENELQLNTTNFSRGIYYVNIIIGNQTSTKKLIIE